MRSRDAEIAAQERTVLDAALAYAEAVATERGVEDAAELLCRAARKYHEWTNVRWLLKQPDR